MFLKGKLTTSLRAQWVRLAVVAALSLSTAWADSSSCTSLLTVNTPAPYRQTSSDLNQLYTDAQSASFSFETLLQQVAQTSGSKAGSIGLKNKDRAEAKVLARKSGDAGQIFDILRGSVLCEDLRHVYAVFKALQQLGPNYGVEILEAKDYFKEPKQTGYRDLHVRIKVPFASASGMRGSHIAEIQIHLKNLYDLKKGRGDELYREIRSVREKALQENRPLTSEESTQIRALEDEHRVLFDRAFVRN